MSNEIENFIAAFQKSTNDGTFIRLTLSNYKGHEVHLQRLSVRLVVLKRGTRLMFQFRYANRETVKNFRIEEAVNELRGQLEKGFRNAHLFTFIHDLQLTIGKRNVRLMKGKPSVKTPPEPAHDKRKVKLVDPTAAYLKALGITTDSGTVRGDARDKWNQINRFIEIVGGLIENSSLKNKRDLSVVDMGSGKGYLTFALYDSLTNGTAFGRSNAMTKSRLVSMTGVENRAELVGVCNDLARSLEFSGLRFFEGSIADHELDEVDVLIALHACDTATDDALFMGIKANAEIIVAAPCCHKELRKQLAPPKPLDTVLKHGVLMERTAESLTDGIRALLLEAHGYRSSIFEFVPAEHTQKNNILVGTRKRGSSEPGAAARAHEVLSLFGIRHQRLVRLLEAKSQGE